jgi:serine/threonine protein kinase
MNASTCNPIFDNPKYRLCRFIAKGCAGSVYEVERLDDGHVCALKQCFAKDIEDASLKQALREATILKLIRIPGHEHSDDRFPWVVSIDDFWVDEHLCESDGTYGGIRVNVVMDLVDGPSLDNFIDKISNPRMQMRVAAGSRRVRTGDELSEIDDRMVDLRTDTLYSWVAQMVLALGTIHKLRVIHRDVKPGNLVLSRDLKRVRLVDFSIARIMGPDDSHLNTICGTTNYAAIEVLQGLPYTESCDMWSLGCVLYELLTMQKLFKTSQAMKILQIVTKSFRPSIPEDCDGGLSMICYRLLNVDPKSRPTALQLCRHPRLRPLVVKELMQIGDPMRRYAIANFLQLGDLLSDSHPTVTPNHMTTAGEYRLYDEDGCALNDPIDDFYDEDIQCPILPLLQGDWVLSGSNPDVYVYVCGRKMSFSDNRSELFISRSTHVSSPDVVEWMLGREALLVKSKSVFVHPQKIFFSDLTKRPRIRRGSDTIEPFLVLVRYQPVASEFSTASSTLQ